MKATGSTHHYRQHPILVIEIETAQGTYYQSSNEATACYHADTANDDLKDKEADLTVHNYKTAAAALAAEKAEIEEILGQAEPEEIGEAAYDLANSDSAEWRKQNADRLADAIESLLKDPSETQNARALRQIATNLRKH